MIIAKLSLTIYLKNLPLGSYNVMAMQEAQTQVWRETHHVAGHRSKWNTGTLLFQQAYRNVLARKLNK